MSWSTLGRQVIAGLKPASKYGNIPAYDAYGNRYSSRAEARRGVELDLLERAGEIRNLRRQQRYPLVVKGKDGQDVKICTYVCDFQYHDVATGEEVTEDVKGQRTREYIIKRRLMLACYGITIREVPA